MVSTNEETIKKYKENLLDVAYKYLVKNHMPSRTQFREHHRDNKLTIDKP